jgi:large subunit ribosomal protein L25
MSKQYALTAQKRDRAGKGIARALRRENMVPAVIYGDNKPPVLIALPQKEITLEYHKGYMLTHICNLDVAGEKMMTIARDVQVHPVTDKIESADFLRVNPKTRITVSVAFDFINEDKCVGIKNKGVLNVASHEVELECLVTDIPDSIEVDLTNLDIGDSVLISEIKLPKGAELVSEDDFAVASIVEAEEYVELEIVKPVSDAEVAAASGVAAPAKDAKK